MQFLVEKLKAIILRHIFVVNKENYPIGIISISDINDRVVAEGKDVIIDPYGYDPDEDLYSGQKHKDHTAPDAEKGGFSVVMTS